MFSFALEFKYQWLELNPRAVHMQLFSSEIRDQSDPVFKNSTLETNYNYIEQACGLAPCLI